MNKFKVICVKKCRRGEHGRTTEESPEVGDPCTVIVTEVRHGKLYYGLEEFKTGKKYLSSYFATLPTEDQEIAIEHEQEAIIYQK